MGDRELSFASMSPSSCAQTESGCAFLFAWGTGETVNQQSCIFYGVLIRRVVVSS